MYVCMYVCDLKGKDGKDIVRLAVDYRYVNKYTVGDAYPIPDYSDIVQRVGGSSWISTFDAKSAFWQTKLREVTPVTPVVDCIRV